MHEFTDLIYRCTTFTLASLREANERVIEELQTSSATTLVKALQMVQLQKAILTVGMFSMFEANLQDILGCKNGFARAKEILKNKGQSTTKERFDDLCCAINVLKHGRGDSYNTLVKKAKNLPFRVKLPHESFFSEGDVSEVSTLVEVNDEFVLYCLDVIREVSVSVKCS
ncbi:TPA: hypothetical protein JBD08_07010 [Legionella pneumophila subsp. pneumophila]|nr:hypothetical protein lpt_10575 [Legionella pneumophila subsp. pneumophila]MCH9061725.1 hypothetical protein [Legionella pneumophila serogroup 1]OOK44305.1 hypothetical protein LPM_0423 [Legionella pneumophila subsp. pneumophila str. Mississauga]PQM71214.1 hypothetical protein C3926_10915 [Legionella pneumophila]MCH9064770.1 hypothetical protein [Legionella pneumophila serogroup 1]